MITAADLELLEAVLRHHPKLTRQEAVEYLLEAGGPDFTEPDLPLHKRGFGVREEQPA